MVKINKFFLAFLGLLIGLSPGCTLTTQPPPPTPFSGPAYTQAAQTIMAQLTQLASTPEPTETPPELPSATATPVPTATIQPSQTPSPTETPAPLPTATIRSPKLLFEDDFSLDTGWYVHLTQDFGFQYDQGGYLVYITILNAPIWSVRERVYKNVRQEVDVARLEGAEDGYGGLVCRHDGEGSYYLLAVSSDGSYGIGKSKDGEFEFIQQGTAAQGVINPGKQVNRVRADCIGSTLSLYANGQQLIEIEDNEFTSGFTGLVAGTRIDGPVKILFDNYALYRP